MSKVLRLQETGFSNNLEGWAVSAKYSTDAIDQISDPNGASASRQITSIPSPFARMDLVKTAFKYVAEKNNGQYIHLNGKTTYNEMVSHSLDVGQILFEYDKWANLVDIIVWDKTNDLNALLNSPLPEHKRLGETLQLYLAQDASSYNFNQLKRLYLLNYKNGPKTMNIIGATSPSTLFFCSANDLSFVQDIIFGNDRPFDSDYLPLYLRDIQYHKYLRFLQVSISNFALLFPEFNEYLDACFNLSDSQRKAELMAVSSADAINYASLSVGTAGNSVEILGYPLYKAIQQPTNIGQRSDFVIASKINPGKPLVLPVETFTQAYMYTTAPWNSNTQVPFYTPTSLSSRILPNDGTQYPYLTISDFLQDTIVCMPYDFNKKAFFDGNADANIKDKSYLLPLTNTFFEYFTPEQLLGNVVPNGPKMIEIRKNASGGVTVTLRIPIKKGFIEYKRIYFDGINNPNVDATHNDGCVRSCKFAFGMIPNIGYSQDRYAFYRLGLLSDFTTDFNWDVKCYRKGHLIAASELTRNDSDTHSPKCKTYAVEGSVIDYIQISSALASGIVLPKMRPQIESDQFTFAVDFGTTNTHIEYSVNGAPSTPFDITDQDEQIQLLGDYDLDWRYSFYADFIPQYIGESQEFKFPLRTTLSAAKNTNWDHPVIPMGHANIPFTYERRMEYAYNRILSNLKWSNDPDNVKRIECFIDSLFLLLRNKVILNNGVLNRTKVVWFYPISMTRNRFILFKRVWESAYNKYFGGDVTTNLIAMTESVAPFEFFKGQFGAANIVTIDIGGGTSDVVITELGTVKYITSFRYAANSVFGDGYANLDGSTQNGIVRQFKGHISKILRANNMDDLLKVFQTLDERNDSTDIASFFFSLTGNKRVNEKNLAANLDFHRMLQLDENQKVVFLLFYSSIIYHVAQIMKAKKMAMPRYITFSGNGSRIISVLSDDRKLLEKYTKLIYEKVYGESYNSGGLELRYNNEHPKEATCKGGIIGEHSEDYDSIANTKVVLKGTDDVSFVDKDKYESITESDVLNTSATVKKFIEFTLALNDDFSFKDNFGIDSDSINLAKDICAKDLDIHTRNGLLNKRKEVDNADTVEETMFFYPLHGALNALAASICENKQQV